MALNSLSFLIFLAVVLFFYYIVPKSKQWLILLIASYGFYLFGGVTNVFYIIATTLISFGASHWMQRIRNKQAAELAALGDTISKEEKRTMKKCAAARIHRIQVLTVLVNLGVLAYVKYLNFFIANANNLFTLFRWDISMPLVNILVPLGLSYYTFNSIGYLIDVGRGKLAAERHFGKFALFVSFFPSIVQGPLMRYGDVGLQLQQPHKLEYKNLKYGGQLILWGLFKKMVIADRLAAVTATVFNPEFTDFNGAQVLFAVLAYSFQIYGDFSGGTDITRGAAQMMGIELPLNFARPFFATSMADFWRRWHMSLGAWMREYVFYPVMLSKPVTAVSKTFRKRFGSYAGKIVPSVAAPMVVFFLIGIWHGLTWQYIINGLYNALLISASVALIPVYKWLAEKLKVNTESFGFRVFQILRTFFLLCISRIIVKAPSIGVALQMMKAVVTDFDWAFITGANGEIFKLGINEKELTLILICILVLFVVGVLQERGVQLRETIAQQNIVFRWTLYLLLIFAILIFGVYGPGYDASVFIYGRF